VARLELEKAEAGHYPTLDVLAQITRSGSESVTSPGTGYSNRMIGVQLNLPLYAGGQVSSLARQALAEQLRAEALLELARRELAVQLHREFRGVTEGILKVRALEQALKSAEQLVLSSQRSWQAGSRTVVDIFNAQEQAQLVRRDLAQARAQQLMARVRLVVLAGQDGAQMLAELNGWLTPP
jgi:outer membrane protein TolC